MKVVLFDLGRTLEHNDVLLPGANELLDAIEDMRDDVGARPELGLVSDYFPASTPAEIETHRTSYYAILETLGIRARFEPVAKRVTLSTEVGVNKPDERIFRTALDKLGSAVSFADSIFITEAQEHVNACRNLGMSAIHFQGPGQTGGEIDELTEAIPIIKSFVEQA